jgi:hypothetical protein
VRSLEACGRGLSIRGWPDPGQGKQEAVTFHKDRRPAHFHFAPLAFLKADRIGEGERGLPKRKRPPDRVSLRAIVLGKPSKRFWRQHCRVTCGVVSEIQLVVATEGIACDGSAGDETSRQPFFVQCPSSCVASRSATPDLESVDATRSTSRPESSQPQDIWILQSQDSCRALQEIKLHRARSSTQIRLYL